MSIFLLFQPEYKIPLKQFVTIVVNCINGVQQFTPRKKLVYVLVNINYSL